MDEQRRFRDVFGLFPTGVAVVTAAGDSGPAGMTTNAVASVSLEPLLVLVCFDNTSRTLPVVRDAGRFAVNLLRAGQQELAAVFASKRPAAEKFAGLDVEHVDGVPVLNTALAWVTCELRALHPAGDHTIGIGEVSGMDLDAAGEPLVWFAGAYTGLPAPARPSGVRAPGSSSGP